LIVIIDRTQERELEERLRHANHELERAYEELQSTNEELETTNEELQSTIEELETTNEELQSTNEELETMNEELHSTNDELHMVNDEARVRADEVGELNHFLNAILTSLRDAVVVVGPDHNVRLWNAHATELWGLREEEVRGSNFFDLDTGLPVEQLRTNFERSLKNGANGTEVVVDAVTRRGKPVRCHVTMNALTGRDGHHGTIIVMEAEPA
jgi:two-component system, chemotaxis family, CheB/CheR fusion protein